MKKAIITGATGFVGGWLIKELIAQGVQVIAIVRSLDAAKSILDKYEQVRVVICPFSEILSMPSLISDRDIDVLYHFAWGGTAGNQRGDVRLQLGNIQSTCDLIEAASKIGCKRFVNAGSIMEYETMQYVSKDDSTPGLSNVYSTAKLAADFMAKTLATNLKISYINVIISNIYGPGEKSLRFINSTIGSFLNNEKTAFTKGDQLYDFIYASDAAKALYLVGKSGRSNNSYYIGNKYQYPLRRYIAIMRDIVNKNIELTFGEIPFCGAKLNYTEFDTNKVYSEFGFEPEVTFEEGISKTMMWIINKDNL